MKAYKRLFLALLSCVTIIASAGCTSSAIPDAAEEEEEEEKTVETLTIEDEEYYRRFRGDGISINVYNWGEYICDGSAEGTLDVNREFEELTGINVNYTTFGSNEELYAKLRDGAVSYDVVIPSDYMISRFIKEGLVQKLDMSNIPNSKYILDTFKGLEYDPNDEYSVPYTWGTVGIIYNKEVIGIEEEDIDWDILWNEDYSGEILMFDNPRDAFAIAEIMQGSSLNTEDPKELKAAAQKLIEQKPLVQAYVMDEVFDKMGGSEALIAPYYAGDALTILEDNDSLSFAVPKSGTNLFVDAMCIPASAKQKEAAEMYINFMCEPDIALANIDYICYSTPHSAAYEMLDEEVRENPVTYPDEKFVAENTEVFANLSDEAAELMQKLWTDMKTAEDKDQKSWLTPVFLAVSLILVAVIQLRRHFRAKRDIY